MKEFGLIIAGSGRPVSYNHYMGEFTLPTVIPTGRTIPVSRSLMPAVMRIASHLHPEKIILFGSYAYGSPTSDSDVDLLVIWDTDLPRKERAWQVSQLLIPRPFPVDILVKTPLEIAYALDSGDFFIREIMQRGIVLYDRNQ